MSVRLVALALGVLVCVSVAGCKKRPASGPIGAESPQLAVVGWLADVHEGDFAKAARRAPPGLEARLLEELEADLKSRFEGLRRVDDAPFALSPPEEGRAQARLTVERPSAGQEPLVIDLRQVDGKWYVEPPRLGETPAG